ncbi:hypothetical protein ABZ934_02610 [Streptomyces sp. NPDC046557]|uniref:hypothetical protein n=1 Tax=Streptomyces sp. NPDC046557 TaxID=3155372 RepID=UPI0033FDA566
MALAAGEYGLRDLTAVTTLDNPASMAVLKSNGFSATGETLIGDRPAVRYALRLPTRP